MLDEKPLWTCPKCGAKFVTANIWHSCGPWTIDGFLEGKGPKAHQFFNKLKDIVGSCGPYELAAAKTEIAFMVRVRFAQVKRLSERGMTVAFWLKHRIDSPRFTRVDQITKKDWIYTFRTTRLEELDIEVQRWLCLAYKVGKQEAHMN